MSIYKKIAEMQQNLLKEQFQTKQGFHGKYIPLPVMLPPILNECFEKELTLYFTSTTEHLILKLMSWDKKEEFSCRVRLPDLTREEKDEGKKITYLKRYLLMNTFMILEEGFDPDDEPDVASSAKKQEENTPVEEIKHSLNLEELYENALKKLIEVKGLTDEEITHAAIRKQIFNDGDFKSKSERNEIAKYCKKTWGAS